MAITLQAVSESIADETLGLGGSQEAGPAVADYIPVSIRALSEVKMILGMTPLNGAGAPTLSTVADPTVA